MINNTLMVPVKRSVLCTVWITLMNMFRVVIMKKPNLLPAYQVIEQIRKEEKKIAKERLAVEKGKSGKRG